MKLSTAWIFSHINADYTEYDIMQLVEKFNLTTAEIEYVEKISFDVNDFTLAHVSQIKVDSIVLYSRELSQEIELPLRQDCLNDYFYVLVKDDGNWRWARMRDWKSTKEGLLPAFSCTGQQCEGLWKEMFQAQDYILHVDNTSITNRPDLWSHRGFAREIAAMWGLSLCDEQTIYATHPIAAHERRASQATGNPFSFELEDPEYCKKFAALYIANIGHHASWLWMAQKLCKVDIKPIDALVDTTNYVMLDIGQPLHVFDAEKINSDFIVPRLAHKSETLQLLDGQTVELTDYDVVITNGKRPIALGGIMGGKDSAVSLKTRSILVEAANFDAATIRRTSRRFKIRTDASSRFEKTLDPNLNILGLLRFLNILEQQNIQLITASDIISLGKIIEPSTIEIMHKKIEQSLGMSLSTDFIQKTLEALEFSVQVIQKDEEYGYSITVPTFRSTKDVQLPEDIIEEIGRFYGFGTIPLELPKLELKPNNLHAVLRLRQIRQFMVDSLQAHEVYNYSFYDESFLQELQWKPESMVALVNPVSYNWQRLVTSLVPHIIRSVVHAGTHQEEIRFFEWGRIWRRKENEVEEQKSLVGIIYNKKKSVNFYWAKDHVERLFDFLGISITWSKYDGLQPWYHPYKTAKLTYENEVIGYAGIANAAFIQTVLEGHAFIFELSGNILLKATREKETFKSLNKYQDSWFDVSMFLPLEVTVESITDIIRNIDNRIVSVELIDFFEKKEWIDKRSATLRIAMQAPDKTLIKEEIDVLYGKVVQVLQKYGVTIR